MRWLIFSFVPALKSCPISSCKVTSEKDYPLGILGLCLSSGPVLSCIFLQSHLQARGAAHWPEIWLDARWPAWARDEHSLPPALTEWWACNWGVLPIRVPRLRYKQQEPHPHPHACGLGTSEGHNVALYSVASLGPVIDPNGHWSCEFLWCCFSLKAVYMHGMPTHLPTCTVKVSGRIDRNDWCMRWEGLTKSSGSEQ